MSFTHPAILVATAAFCAATGLLLRSSARRRSHMAFTYSDLAFLRAAAAPRTWPLPLLFAGVLFACALTGLSLAGPHLVLPVPVNDGRVVICIDTSGSMRSLDIAPSRAEAAKAAANAFISRTAPGTRIGIISFASAAAIIAPLTADRAQALSALDLVPPPDGATAIGDALAAAGRLLGTRGSRAVIVITDGVNNRGADPVQAALALAREQVRIYTVGIGSNGSGELIPGTAEPATLDEETLRTLGQIGHGSYAHAQDAGQLSATLAGLGHSTTMEKHQVDASPIAALAGGIAFVGVLFGALAAGRFP